MKHLTYHVPEYVLASFSEMLQQVAILLTVVIGPFIVFALIIHWLERVIQSQLARTFGWNSVLWTGWLGTPIHELSHVLMCKLFRHRIDEMVLFEPDRETGRLGYVRHSYKAGNWFEEIGNVFIGLAPLIGGSIALAALLWGFYPDIATEAIDSAAGETTGIATQTVTMVRAVFRGIFNASDYGTIRFWAFIYLVLCVGSHMAPSGSDYRGAGRGAIILGVGLLILATAAAWIMPDLAAVSSSLAEILSPLFAVLVLTVVLCSLATILIVLLTAIVQQLWK